MPKFFKISRLPIIGYNNFLYRSWGVPAPLHPLAMPMRAQWRTGHTGIQAAETCNGKHLLNSNRSTNLSIFFSNGNHSTNILMANCIGWSFSKLSSRLAGIFTQIVKNVVILVRFVWIDVCFIAASGAGHRSLDSIQFFLMLLSSSFSSCTWISTSTFNSLFQVFLGRSLPCGVHCITCTVLLSSLLLNVWSSQFHFLLHVYALVLHHAVLDNLSGQCVYLWSFAGICC